MSTPVRIAFEKGIETLPLSSLLLLRAIPPELKQTPKYKRIARSIAEIGIKKSRNRHALRRRKADVAAAGGGPVEKV